KGTYPRVLQDERYGEAARSLFADAEVMLADMVRDKWLTAKGVIGLWRAQSDGDDIVLYDGHGAEVSRLHTLRQQIARAGKRANVAMADFVAPIGGPEDFIGGFCVTAGLGEEEVAARFDKAGDDYGKILSQSLSDRLAEAFAEYAHMLIRRELWGYAADETLTPDQMIAEDYAGIRPAPGYPAQPDHTEKRTLFQLLEAPERTGVNLTESCAMWPASSVSGLYFSHPDSFYFGVGKIERDQVEDYARRKGWEVAEAERWLAPILNYVPSPLLEAA
ncbi:MAG: vitamin B12 dependent-methionine synthase activation domain-containing protein, partial [Pseudomonadota bacterium]